MNSLFPSFAIQRVGVPFFWKFYNYCSKKQNQALSTQTSGNKDKRGQIVVESDWLFGCYTTKPLVVENIGVRATEITSFLGQNAHDSGNDT